jgi:phosphohistidine phosphatase
MRASNHKANQAVKKIETLFWCIAANVLTFVQNLILRTLYLMRHGQALSAEMGQTDFYRKLSEKGEADIAQEAQLLLEKAIQFDLVLCSPTERTQKTAGILVHGMGLKHEIIEFETRLVNASPDQIFFCIMEANPEANHLLVVAHNPGISNLAGMLSTQTPILSFQPGGIAAFHYPEARSWMEAAQQEPDFLWYVQP